MDSLKGEIWVDIKNYEGRYKISNLGRILSVKRRDSLGRLVGGIILKQQLDKRGYPKIRIGWNEDRKSFRVHRLVALHFLDNPLNKRTVNHIDGVKSNNCLENLEWSTDVENMRHSYAKGLHKNPSGALSKRFNCPVRVFDMDENYLYSLNGNLDMKNHGFDFRLVSAVVLGKRGSHKSHKFDRLNNGPYNKSPHLARDERKLNNKRIKCSYCGRVGALAQMKRWHFKNCKEFTLDK